MYNSTRITNNRSDIVLENITFNKKRRYIIKNKLRFITFLIILFVSVSVLFNILFSHDNEVFGYNKFKTDYESYLGDSYILYEVKSGDTLWSIAKIHGNKDNDIRKNVHIISTENNITDSTIKAGDILKVRI